MKNRMKNLTKVFLLCVAMITSQLSSIAQGAITQQAVTAWEKYFSSIKTLRLEYRYTDSQGKIYRDTAIKSSFYLDGDMYRLENNFKPGGYKTLSINAFNGKEYQEFGIFSGSPELTLSKKNDSDLPYGGAPMPLSLFGFAFGSKDVMSFKTVRNDTHWQKVLKGMIHVRSFTSNGETHNVFRVDIGRGVWDVETVGSTFFPTKISSRGTTNGGNVVIGTSTITKRFAWSANGQTYYFPLAGTSSSKDDRGRAYPPKTDGIMQIIVDEKTLEINKPISKAVFTIPKSQAKIIIDADKLWEASKMKKPKSTPTRK